MGYVWIPPLGNPVKKICLSISQAIFLLFRYISSDDISLDKQSLFPSSNEPLLCLSLYALSYISLDGNYES